MSRAVLRLLLCLTVCATMTQYWIYLRPSLILTVTLKLLLPTILSWIQLHRGVASLKKTWRVCKCRIYLILRALKEVPIPQLVAYAVVRAPPWYWIYQWYIRCWTGFFKNNRTVNFRFIYTIYKPAINLVSGRAVPQSSQFPWLPVSSFELWNVPATVMFGTLHDSKEIFSLSQS